MTREKINPDARELADRIFDEGSNQKDILEALDAIEGNKDIFMSQHALRAAIMYSSKMDDFSINSPEVLNSLIKDIKISFDNIMFVDEFNVKTSSLSLPTTWLKAQDALGGDISLVMKLADGHLRPPRLATALRYLADALGVTTDQVRSHFRDGQVAGTTADEFSSKAKPISHGLEDFEDAVRDATIPDAIRRQMIGE